jgi:pSer/pThr/pTyr-binding forkhead associated (FHA) protein
MRIQLRAIASDKQAWTVGSEGEREILIERVGVSALHAKIVNEGKRWKVIDQLSANGTFVNGKRCNVSYLTSGDRIAFGSVECIFHLPTGSAAQPAARGAGLGKVLIIAGLSFVVTLVLLFVLLKKFGWL